MKRKMKIYLSGPIKNQLLDTVERKFRSAEELVRKMGYDPVSPITISKKIEGFSKWNELSMDEKIKAYMRADVSALLTCDAIFMMKGWEDSSGARLEFLVAQACGLSITYQN
jgi:hypothetical protein